MNLVPSSSRLAAAATGVVLILAGVPALGAPRTPAPGPATAAGPSGDAQASPGGAQPSSSGAPASSGGAPASPGGAPDSPVGVEAAGLGGTDVEAEPAPDPIRTGPAMQAIELLPAAGASPTGRSFGAPDRARAEAAAGALAVSQRGTEAFSLLGATWTDPRARLDGTVEVRTRSVATGRWTDWQPLDSDGISPADPGGADGNGRGRTDPLWVGTSDGVEARVAAAAGRARPLPAGLRLDLINPDEPHGAPRARTEAAPRARTEAAPRARTEAGPRDLGARAPRGFAAGAPRDLGARAPRDLGAGAPRGFDATQREKAAAAGSAAARVAVPARPVPAMITRAGWGANEAIVEDPPEYTTDVQVVFVHHTAGTNNYNCRDSARIVRGIEAYHVRSNKWNDIGYNFLVDKCGTLFEGRKGGVNRAVLGAHTLGFNAHSSAIAVLGNYQSRGVTARVKTVIAQVAAYKLGAYGNLATGRTMLLSGGSDRYPKGRLASLNRVSGHRDTGQTACPGSTLYGQLGSIRSIAGAGPAGLRLLRMTGAVAVGSTYYTRGLISPLWTTSTPSALLNRFDVYVDGKLTLSARNSHRKGALRLSAGRHTVLVRAIHLSGRTASFAKTVVVDATAPQFTVGPAVVLRTGSLNGSVPIRLGWTAADVGGLRSVSLTRPRAVGLGTNAQDWLGVARPGVPNTWTLRAADRAGNTRSASVTRTPVVVSEAVAARAGSWVTLRNSAYLSGNALRSSARGSSLSWTFTGRSAAIAVSRGTASGKVTVYVDGQPAGTLDLRASSTLNRRAIWAKNWGAAGRHTVKVVVAGTAGRPGVVLDGLVVLR